MMKPILIYLFLGSMLAAMAATKMQHDCPHDELPSVAGHVDFVFEWLPAFIGYGIARNKDDHYECKAK